MNESLDDRLDAAMRTLRAELDHDLDHDAVAPFRPTPRRSPMLASVVVVFAALGAVFWATRGDDESMVSTWPNP